jgi:hypothetical protein
MRLLSFIFILTLLSACATPDISSFKQSSLALTSGLNNNQNTLLASGNDIADKLNRPKKLVDNIAGLRKQGKVVEQLGAVLATYATSVSRLASEGENGEKAANELVGNLKDTISSFTGKTINLPPSVSSLSAAFGKIQQQAKNKELHKIMAELQPEVDTIADALEKMPNGENGIINAMTTYWQSQRQDLINYHKAHESLLERAKKLDKNTSLELNNDLKQCNAAEQCDYTALLTKHRAATAKNANERVNLQVLLNEIMPFELAFQAWNKEINDWKLGAKARIGGIPELAKAWQNDHQAIIDYLQKCSKLSSMFDSKCKVFSSANLEIFGTLLGKAAFPI